MGGGTGTEVPSLWTRISPNTVPLVALVIPVRLPEARVRFAPLSAVIFLTAVWSIANPVLEAILTEEEA